VNACNPRKIVHVVEDSEEDRNGEGEFHKNRSSDIRTKSKYPIPENSILEKEARIISILKIV
jgi:hypothetical protein